MSEEKSGWDKIAEQDGQSEKKQATEEKMKTAAETVSSVSWIIYVAAVAVICIVVLAVLKVFGGR